MRWHHQYSGPSVSARGAAYFIIIRGHTWNSNHSLVQSRECPVHDATRILNGLRQLPRSRFLGRDLQTGAWLVSTRDWYKQLNFHSIFRYYLYNINILIRSVWERMLQLHISDMLIAFSFNSSFLSAFALSRVTLESLGCLLEVAHEYNRTVSH